MNHAHEAIRRRRQTLDWVIPALCLLWSIGPAIGMAPAWGTERAMEFGGWLTYWDFTRGGQSIENAPDIYRDIFLFSAHFDQEAALVVANPGGHDYESAVRRWKTQGRRTWLTLVNDVQAGPAGTFLLKDPHTIHRLLKTESSRTRHIRDILVKATGLGVGGVDIDYENLHPQDRVAFTAFIAELANTLEGHHLRLSVTVQPKTRPVRSQGAGAMDWAALCRHADRVQIMLYNLHNSKTEPGPVATPSWIAQVLAYAQTQCPGDRLVPVLKVSGMRWGQNQTEAIHYEGAIRLLREHRVSPLRLAPSQVPYFSYGDPTEPGTVYFEDARSLTEKLNTLWALNLRRVVFWSLGREDPELPAALRAFNRTVADSFKNGSPASQGP